MEVRTLGGELPSGRLYLRKLPVKEPGKLPIVPVDGRAAEVRAIKVS
jgi:hypothetical protein